MLFINVVLFVNVVSALHGDDDNVICRWFLLLFICENVDCIIENVDCNG